MPYDLIETQFSVGDTVYRVIRDNRHKIQCPVCVGKKNVVLRPENSSKEICCPECWGSGEINEPCAMDWQTTQVRIMEIKTHKRSDCGNQNTKVEYLITPGHNTHFSDPEWVEEAQLHATEQQVQARISVLVLRDEQFDANKRKSTQPVTE